MNTDKNKQLLWKLLYNKQYFTTFENNQFYKIKELFDNLIQQIDSKNDTLLNKNKEFIKLFINELNILKEPYKREDLINNRQEKLLNDFNKKTDEFNEFKLTRPPEINFSDLIEETPIHLLNDTKNLTQKRETDLPILQQILSILKEICNNQQEILDILNEPLISETTKNYNSNTIADNTNILPNTELINMNINE